MCGLVAVFDCDEYGSAHLDKMCSTIAHRGPDSKGIVILKDN
jgi:asparagine synthetase B (glutamine-hydrolysing)